jgi:hypothetical protein
MCLQLLLKFWISERVAPSRYAIEYGVIKVRGYFSDGAVQLCRDEARLALHKLGVCGPCDKESSLICWIHCEKIDHYDWASIYFGLTANGI